MLRGQSQAKSTSQSKSGEPKSKRRLYGTRLAGALFYVTLFSIFQLFGYLINYTASYGSNLFEYPGVYPLNFLLASLSIFHTDHYQLLRNTERPKLRRK